MTWFNRKVGWPFTVGWAIVMVGAFMIGVIQP